MRPLWLRIATWLNARVLGYRWSSFDAWVWDRQLERDDVRVLM